MIIGTAGHIDHGKTSLVKALTGVDADRLKEEKERGITVDLGFAYQPLPDGDVLGFVDVPGHEKLVRNMLAGATGIDHVMLVVAADDGPMPQTREHLAILRLLGLTQGVVVLNKCDLVDSVRLAEATREIRELLAEGAPADGLALAPILPVSTLTGQGLDALRAHLDAARHTVNSRQRDAHFRLAVDRCFTLSGTGTVLTGTASSGSVRVGDQLLVSPAGLSVRVRSIHAQNQTTLQGLAGQRLALNVSGVEKSQVQRGDWLMHESLHAPTQRLDVHLRILPGEARPLAHWTPVHLHLGAEDVQARVLLLEGATLAPGDSAFAQLELERPIGALWADRFILRDQSDLRTLGGGQVVDAHPPANRRKRSQRVEALRALALEDPQAALAGSLALQPPHGLDSAAFLRQRNLQPERQQAILAAVPHRQVMDGGRSLLFAPQQIEAYLRAITDHLAAFHRKTPDSPGLTQEQLTRHVRAKPATAVFALLLQQAVKDGALRRNGPHLALAGHEATLQGVEKQIWERLKPWLDEGGLHPPKLSDMLERDRNLRKDQVMRTLQRLQRMGQVHAVGAEYFIRTPHLLQLALQCKALADADANHRLNVREMRENMGISRHLSVPLVEYFDEIGLTARDAVGRHFKRDPRKMFEG